MAHVDPARLAKSSALQRAGRFEFACLMPGITKRNARHTHLTPKQGAANEKWISLLAALAIVSRCTPSP